MKEELTIKPETFGLTTEKGISILESFNPKLTELSALQQEYTELIKKEITLELVAEAKVFYKQITTFESSLNTIHKAEKDFYLQGGRFVDALKNKGIVHSAEMKVKVKAIVDYYANIEKAKLVELEVERRNLLEPFYKETHLLDLRTMADDVFENFLSAKKATHELEVKAQSEADELENDRLTKLSKQLQTRKDELSKLGLIGVESVLKNVNETEYTEYVNGLKVAKIATLIQGSSVSGSNIVLFDGVEVNGIEFLNSTDRKERIKSNNENYTKHLAAQEAERKKLELSKLSESEAIKKWIESFKIDDAPIENEVTKTIIKQFQAFVAGAKKQI